MKNKIFKIKIIISILTIIIDLYCIFLFTNNTEQNYMPTAAKVDLQPILNKSSLSSEDYSLLFSQTGLTRPAIDDLIAEDTGIFNILSFQNNYLKRINIYSKNVNPFTVEESIMVNGVVSNNNLIAPLKNGDILLTKSVHTLFWRHGHCGIVIDAQKGIVLESLTPGTISTKQNISEWQHYPTLKVMRLKGASQQICEKIAKYAAENLVGIKYKILALKNYNKTKLKGENCSQMIWQAYNHFGYDIDGDKGMIVTPEDIAESGLLEVVQTYGFDPQKDW